MVTLMLMKIANTSFKKDVENVITQDYGGYGAVIDHVLVRKKKI